MWSVSFSLFKVSMSYWIEKSNGRQNVPKNMAPASWQRQYSGGVKYIIWIQSLQIFPRKMKLNTHYTRHRFCFSFFNTYSLLHKLLIYNNLSSPGSLIAYKLICTGKKTMNILYLKKNSLYCLQHTYTFWKMNYLTMYKLFS